jgi:16S rRNA C1402 (ribose-2'-O) methylase RsmI
MSKREYFAGQIMAGLVSDPGLQLFDETQKAGTATHAVSLADALLEALAQGEQS